MLQDDSQSQELADEACVALCFWGELDLAQITQAIGHAPTHSHKKGEIGSSGKPYPSDAWILELRQFDPFDLDELLNRLLALVPTNLKKMNWLPPNSRSRLDLALHTEKGHQAMLSSTTLRRISALNIGLKVDVYAYKADA